MNDFIRLISLFITGLWLLYWFYTRRQTEREKPKNTTHFHLNSYETLSKIIIFISFVLLFMQLLGMKILSFPSNQLVHIIGLSLIVLGVCISVAARRELGSNWAASYEYQVKKKQELVTSGIYKYIRHPIYIGILLIYLGGELVVGSWLVVFYALFTIGMTIQGKKEEKLLWEHFGKEYVQYKQKTKMFIPFIW